MLEMHLTLESLLEEKVCDSTFSMGKVFDELLKKVHLEDLQVFNLIFTFSWISIFLSQLFKEKGF